MGSAGRTHPQCGRLVRDARKRHHLDQRSLAERAGTTQAAISRIERDVVSPSLRTLERLFQAMDETVMLETASLDRPPRGGGNTSIRELRSDYAKLSVEERLEQAARLSEIQTELAAGRPPR